MQQFKYQSINKDGTSENGLVSAVNETSAVSILRGRGLIITDLVIKKDLNPLNFLDNLRGVGSEELVVFTRQLATMISAGLAINQALKILAEQAKSQKLVKAINEVIVEVDAGSSLYQALSKHSVIFPRLFLSLVKAGEASGNLDTILTRLADTLQKENEFKSKTKGALIYPAIILVVMLGVMVVMFVFVIPKLAELYEQMNVELPLMTRLMVGVGNFARGFWWLNVLILAVLYFLYKKFSQTEKGRFLIDDIKFRLPVLGAVSKESQLASFIRTFAALIGAGLPILDGLDIAGDTLTNSRLRQGISVVAKKVEKGQSLARPLRENPDFPTLIAEMVAVGEETGKMEEVLIKLSEYFSDRAEQASKNLATAIEPIIMVFLGAGVGVLIITLILPIYSLTSKF